MSGVFAGLVGSVKAAAVAPTNLVLNGSATTTSTTNYFYATRNTSVYNTAPAGWQSGFDGGPEQEAVEYYHTNLLTVGSRYSVSANIKTAAFQDVNMAVYFGTTLANLSKTGTTSTWTNYKIENILCATNGNLNIYVAGNYGNVFYIDDIACVAGATAI